MLLTSLMKCKSEESAIDSSLMECLTECYKNADHWSARRQILPIMANKVGFEDLRRWLPNLTIARHHLLPPWQRFQCPYCQKHQDVYRPRKAGPLPGIHNQYTYPTRSAVGEKTLKLSSGSEIKVPSVALDLPEHIVLQYVSYCSDTGFTPMSRSVLCKVLKVCSASTSDLRIATTKILAGFAGTDRARIFTVDAMYVRGLPTSSFFLSLQQQREKPLFTGIYYLHYRLKFFATAKMNFTRKNPLL